MAKANKNYKSNMSNLKQENGFKNLNSKINKRMGSMMKNSNRSNGEVKQGYTASAFKAANSSKSKQY